MGGMNKIVGTLQDLTQMFIDGDPELHEIGVMFNKAENSAKIAQNPYRASDYAGVETGRKRSHSPASDTCAANEGVDSGAQ